MAQTDAAQAVTALADYKAEIAERDRRAAVSAMQETKRRIAAFDEVQHNAEQQLQVARADAAGAAAALERLQQRLAAAEQRGRDADYVFKGAVVAGAADRDSTFPIFARNGIDIKYLGLSAATLPALNFGANQFNVGSRSAATGSLQLNGLIGELIRYVGTSYALDGSLDANLIAKFS